ncbi:efflux RND transporter permease subunit [Natranaerobius thermophilus]|uniref:Acriflavin resistance protein n=1 Tax=Natranaerobius thermophilus (strain ATCC BAA-1301 / DSM 18059 / JW/NM-WN-LF) TaxID=457570 RepID=B2A6I0_NATTJ|nr:efflux RND transporter permease subunit [Natranaerobius thermophilus]ACB85513.1 acriflavin resistance protein [Natranaerobius thermophilus JW/NM-WN-LF]
MFLSKIALKRPVTIIMAVVIILLLATVSFSRIPIDLYPDMELPVLFVQTDYEGAGPHEVENMVSRPLEETLSTVDNLSQITSISQQDSSQIIMEFDWGTDMDFAALDTRELIDMIGEQLPDDAGDPTVMQLDPDMMPILQVGINAPEMDLQEISELAEGTIQTQVERIEGVGEVNVMGGVEREIKIHVDPYLLSSYQEVSYENIREAIAANNMDISAGEIRDGDGKYAIRTIGQFEDPDEIKDIQIGVEGESPVKLGDVARVEDTVEDMEPLSRINQEPSVSLGIRNQSDANAVRVAQDVRAELANLEESLPGNVQFEIVTDQSTFIEESIDSIIEMGIIGAILAMIVLWLFLGNFRTTLIIGFAIPISIISTFNLMYFQGYTMNLITMGGLTLGIGMVVDSSIILLENIFRKREQGLSSYEGALQGSKEISGAIIAATLTSMAAFLPAAYTEGIAGIIFEPMAWTVVFALFASLLVALTLVPMLTDKVMGEGVDFNRKSYLPRKMDQGLQWLTNKYGQLVDWVLSKRFVVIVSFIGLMIITVLIFPLMGFEFFPPEDSGEITVDIQYPVGTPLDTTSDNLLELEEEISQVEGVETVFATAGGGGDFVVGGDSRSGTINVIMEDDHQRTTFEVVDEIRGLIPERGGVDVTVSADDMAEEGGGMEGEEDLTVLIKGDDMEELESISDEIAENALTVPGVVNTTTNFEDATMEIQIDVDEASADSYGLTTVTIGNFVRQVSEGELVSFYREGGEEYDITMEMEPSQGISVSTLESLLINTPTGEQVPLEEVASLEMAETPRQIEREDRVRTGTVGVQIEGRDIGRTAGDIREVLDESIELPPDYTMDFGGTYEMMMESFEGLGLALILAVLLVYMVMAAQFESLLYPFIVMFTIPLALIGVILALLVTGHSLSIVAFMGVIMLAGIVVNNGIVMVDFINKLYHEQGYNRIEAIVTAGKIRLRPILMTVLTTILGMLPMASGAGEGAEVRAPMAIAIIGGLAVSTIITLVLIPVVYSLFDDLRLRFHSKLARKEESGDLIVKN